MPKRRSQKRGTVETKYFTAEQAYKRLDVFLAEASGLSRTRIQEYIEEGRVLDERGSTCKSKAAVPVGACFSLSEPEPKHIEAVPENIPLNIVYEDADLCVLHKPRGMVVHPAPGNESGTLVNALLYHFGELSSIGGEFRPGIVHRIDKMTSGLLVVAKNNETHMALTEQFSVHSAGRSYVAIVHGNIREDGGTVDEPIDRHPVDRKRMAVSPKGRRAVTHFKVLERFSTAAFIQCTLETGRTHQIRVHMAYKHHPLLGDGVYCSSPDTYHLGGQALHGYRLTFRHPRTGEELHFCAPMPDCMTEVLQKLGWSGTLPEDYHLY